MEKDSSRAVIQPRLKILAQFEKPGKWAEKWEKNPMGNKMTAATKEKQFQWNKGVEIENLIRCLANFKAQVEYKNFEFNAFGELGELEDIFSFYASVYFWLRDM